MALAATISTLTDDLITAVVRIAPDQKDSARISKLKRRVEGALRTGSHGRTDQFAVASQLEGLQEKFQVLNRDELADALRSRLSELEGYRKTWTPEILSLFLQLSDRPALLSKIERLPKLVEPLAKTESLSWSDLNAHGAAYSDEDIWEEVDFAAESADDDFSSISSDVLSPGVIARTSDDPEEEYVVTNENFVPAVDDNLISSIGKTQFWRIENHPAVPRSKEDASCTITELQLARETIFMLQGLPTSIFWRLDDDIEVDRRYALAHSSNEALSSLLHSFCGIGAKIDAVRRFTNIRQSVPYMQTLCRGIEEWLLEFDGVLSRTQRQCLSAGSTVSLLHLLDDVRQGSRRLILLADLVSSLGENIVDQPACCLNSLYDLVCMLEALSDDHAFRSLAELFLSCFKTYLRPIQLWMENGQLDSADSTFIRVNRENHELRTLWHDWYALDEGVHRHNIPRFLEASIRRVFTTGKNMVFLHHLNALPDGSEPAEQSAMTFDNLFSESSSSLGLPFSALVEAAFDKMVDVNHSASSDRLRAVLGEQCGLWISLDALQHVYLGKNLSVLSILDAKVFELMDKGRSWDDRFLLTELARTAFNTVDLLDPSRLVVRAAGSSSDQVRRHERTVKIIEAILIDYILPWPVANIITEDAMQSYRRIATFLMQIRRAKYVIMKQRLRDARHTAVHGKADTLARALHHSLLWFLDSLYGHITYLVISTAAQSLHAALSSAEDIDAMIAAHQSYISSLEDQCLLSENLAPIHEAIMNILDLCIHFADLRTVHFCDNIELQRRTSNDSLSSKDPEDAFDSDEDENEDFAQDHTLPVTLRESPYDQQMRTVKRQFEHLVNFTADGLKGVARVDGLPSWDILADRLEWRKESFRF